MKRKLLFTFIITLLLFPWTVAYAYDSTAASTGRGEITSADAASLPKFNVYGNAVGSVNPGDIFTIDNTGKDAGTAFTLYLANADELVHNFRYMTLNIGIYVRDDTGAWVGVPAYENFQGICLTMQNGSVSFTLAGNAKYKVTIEKGCFYCFGTSGKRTFALPEFYLAAN
jgi:hypothetical protein